MNEKGYTMIRERLGKELLYFDGGMGTLLQERGLEPGELPETWNLTHADEIRQIHRSYIEAGSDIILRLIPSAPMRSNFMTTGTPWKRS